MARLARLRQVVAWQASPGLLGPGVGRRSRSGTESAGRPGFGEVSVRQGRTGVVRSRRTLIWRGEAREARQAWREAVSRGPGEQREKPGGAGMAGEARHGLIVARPEEASHGRHG